MTDQKPQKPDTTEQKQDPQLKPDQHDKEQKDQNQPARADQAKRVK